MRTSAAAQKLIRDFEGCKLTAYRDSVGVWTIGVGCTTNVKQGDKISAEKANELFLADLKIAEDCVSRMVKVPLNENEAGALASFVFNLGCGNLAKSTLLKLLNQMRYADAAQEFLRWDFAGGVKLPGLTRRRAAERKLFLQGI